MEKLADISFFNALEASGHYSFLSGGEVSVFNKLPPKIEYVNWDRFQHTVTDINFILRNLKIAEEENDTRRIDIYSRKIGDQLGNLRWNYDIIKKYIDELGVSLKDWEERFVK